MTSYYEYFFKTEPTNTYPLLTQLAAEISMAMHNFSDEISMLAFTILWCILVTIVSLILFCDLLKILLRWSWGTVTMPANGKVETAEGGCRNSEHEE